MNYASQDRVDTAKNKKKQPKPPKRITARYLYNSGLAYLQRFPASSMHFRFIMNRKINKSCRHHTDQNYEDCQKLLEDLIVQFKELSLLNDSAYLKGMVTSLRRRGLSSLQIKNKLMQKGYQNDKIASEINSYDEDEYADGALSGDHRAILIHARKKRLGPFDIENKKDAGKSLASLARAGFSYDIAKSVIEMKKEDLPEEFKF